MPLKQTAWSLDDLFPGHDSPELEQAFKTLDKKLTQFEKFRPDLKADMDVEHFMDILVASDDISRLASKLYSYAYLAFAADTQNQIIQNLFGRIQQFSAEIENRSLFFKNWWKSLEDPQARRFMDVAGDYAYYLEALRLFKPHTLPESEEKIINLKNATGSQAIITLYDSITNRYKFRFVVDGKKKSLTRGELLPFLRRSEPELRAKAYQEMLRVFTEDGNILGQLYQNLVRDWYNENLTLRHYATPISARNLFNDIPDQAVDSMLEVCRRNAVVFQRFFKVKARHIGVPRLRRYDIYAPVSKSDKVYEYGAATEMILDTFAGFDPQMAGMARQVFEENHIDSEIRPGKQFGAFCSGPAPELTPWVKVNYQSRADDVNTLAHELGHAIHALTARHHNIFTYFACLPLAETASTFAEMLLIDRLLAEEKDEAVRRDIIFRQVDDSYATIMRQAYFALFERRAHDLVNQNASVDELSTAYLENLKEQFGDAVEVSEDFKWEWVSIPHFYQVPFYVYAYTFGQLLVLALYQQYKAEGETFKPRYLKILAAGGSKSPASILKEAGIDINNQAFWQGGFDILDALVKDLEALPV